jgi:hypothetical protein
LYGKKRIPKILSFVMGPVPREMVIDVLGFEITILDKIL